MTKNAETKRLIALYDSFRMAEFMELSSRSSDPNVLLMRRLCVAYGRGGGKEKRIFSSCRCFNQVKALAESGDRIAQANIGMCYRAGVVVRPNLRRAIHWLERSAEQGYPRAQSSLSRALMVLDPDGNRLRAKKLLMASAAQGCAVAMCNLGNYHADQGNYREAERWMKRAIKAGVMCTYPALCQLYALGPSGSPDIGKLYRCLGEAWEHGELESSLRRPNVAALVDAMSAKGSELIDTVALIIDTVARLGCRK